MTLFKTIRRLRFVGCLLLACGWLVIGDVRTAAAQSKPPAEIVTVNGQSITTADIEAVMRARDIPKTLQPTLRKVFAERLIDELLMRAFLAEQKVTVSKEQIDTAVRRAYAAIRRANKKPEEVLKKRGLDEAAFRRQLQLPIAWGKYSRQIISDMEIRELFKKRRGEFDGTKVRARQIVVKRSSGSNAKAIAHLEQLRADILAGKTTFAQAVKDHSTAPSKNQGGDLGEFAYRGTMPVVITRIAFALKTKEISKPFATPFGVHLIQVTERKPGQLSLEDVRPEIVRLLVQQRWSTIVARLRKSAKIEWKTKL